MEYFSVCKSSTTYCKKKTHNCGELREDNTGIQVSLCGWLQYKRLSGDFITLRDAYGITQVIFQDDKVKIGIFKFYCSVLL